MKSWELLHKMYIELPKEEQQEFNKLQAQKVEGPGIKSIKRQRTNTPTTTQIYQSLKSKLTIVPITQVN